MPNTGRCRKPYGFVIQAENTMSKVREWKDADYVNAVGVIIMATLTSTREGGSHGFREWISQGSMEKCGAQRLSLRRFLEVSQCLMGQTDLYRLSRPTVRRT